MTNSKIFLIGGGEISERETEAIDCKALASRKKTGAIVFIGAEAGDSEGYYECFRKYYASLCNDKDFIMLKSTISAKEAKKALLDASFVYLGGGKTEVLYDTLQKWGAKNYSKKYRK